MNANEILTALANGNSKVQAQAFTVFAPTRKPVLIDKDGNILASYQPIKGQTAPLTMVDDLA